MADADAFADQPVTNTTQPGLSIRHASGSEGDRIEFTVTLSPAQDERVTVDYATSDRSATAGADYTAVSGTLAFEPGQTRKTVPVESVEDTLPEGGETFAVTLTAAQNARIKGNRAFGTILDDDDAAVVYVPHNWGPRSVGSGHWRFVPIAIRFVHDEKRRHCGY